MRPLRAVALAGLAVAAAAAVVLRRRRAARPVPPAAHLGLTDGGVRRLAADDPGASGLRAAAAELRAALEQGA